MELTTLDAKYSQLTGLRFKVSELIEAADDADKKKATYDHLVWHIKNGLIRGVDGIKELVEEVLPALAEALEQPSTVEVHEESETDTATQTPTEQETITESATETQTPTEQETPTESATETQTPTESAVETPTESAVETPTEQETPTESATETPTEQQIPDPNDTGEND